MSSALSSCRGTGTGHLPRLDFDEWHAPHRLACEGEAHLAASETAWLLEIHGRRIGLRREDLDIGGSEEDVLIETWPAAAAKLSWRDDQPWFEARVDGITRDGSCSCVALPSRSARAIG